MDIPRVIREVLAVKSLQNLVAFLEPLLRKVVKEEVERGLFQGTILLQRSPRRQIQADSLKLVFSNGVAGTLFTGSKIEDKEDNPLRIHLVGTPGSPPSSPIRVEIVVIDGDFPGERDDWTSEEFDWKIVKERTGKRPLLAGDVHLTLRDGSSTIGDLAFTDNSSWIRSRRFRLGARVVPGSCEGLTVREAMTEPFMVKDHRGELYKKHYPPALRDDVWRLKNIAKDGTFHKKLQAEHVNTVQDFLKLWVIDPDRLRSLVGLPDKTWEATVGHARTCTMGDKLYVHRCRQGDVLVLNPVCKLEGIVVDGRSLPLGTLDRRQQAQVQLLVMEAYENWDTLEEVDEAFGRAILLQQSESCFLFSDH
ncbi:hypothetical protein Taro_044017 [Colocasia esculenta]|uniref:Calmodulin-binding protein n=1 Tax=Colocasia esculenta TaxID=4460 RepID=A0A843X4V7_COLES|nr:hypothetical protein [Colocasia esculenta]